MAHIFLIVEGQTEELFYKRLLQNEYISSDGTYRHYFEVVSMPSKKNIYARGGKGGAVSYEVCINNVKHFLSQTSHCVLVSLIFDYYGIHKTFRSRLSQTQKSLEEKVVAIQQRFENEINNSKFKFRLQVHEYEAYLFSNPEIIAEHFNQPEKLEELTGILASFNNDPELINDDQNTAPTKRFKSIFPNFGKTSDGITIAEKTSIPTIRTHCSKFNELCQLFDDL